MAPDQLSGDTSRTVTWGPFPLRRARLAVGLAVVVFGCLMGFIALLHDTLTCRRGEGGAGECMYESGGRRDRTLRFPLSAVAETGVRYTETRSKGSVTRWGQLVLRIKTPDRERDLVLTRELAEYADPHERELKDFLATPSRGQLRIETQRYTPLVVFALILGLVGLGVLWSVLSGRRRYLLTWDDIGQELWVQPEWPLGIRLGFGAPARHPLRRPVEVEVGWGHVSDFFTHARSVGPRGGSLSIRLEDGSTVSLSERPLLGYGVHLRAAAALRDLLGCPRRSAVDEDRIEATSQAARPEPPAGMQGFGGKIATVWIGTCTGSLLGIFVGALLALTVGHQKSTDMAGGPYFYGGMMAGIAGGVWLAWRVTQNPDLR